MDSLTTGDVPQADDAGTTDENADGLADVGTGNGEWKVSAAMLPSKDVRDGVHFRGLGLLLFAVDDAVSACIVGPDKYAHQLIWIGATIV